MDLQQTIAELEKQAHQYSEAANSLRALLMQEGSGAATASSKTSAKAASKRAATNGRKKGSRKGSRKAAVTPETRAKISAALRASHAARKAREA